MAIEKSINYNTNEKDNVGKCSFTYKMLNERIKSLYLTKPYYGYTLSRMSRTLTIGTERACVVPTQMTLQVNPFYFESIPDEEQIAVLEHEVLHIGFFHHDRYMIIEQDRDEFKTDTFNVAADCAINQLIENMPSDSISLEYVNKFCDEELEAKQNSEYYYKLLINSESYRKHYDTNETLKKMIKKVRKSFEDTYKDVTSVTKAMFKKIMRTAKKKQAAHEKMVGTMGGFSLVAVLPSYDGPVHKDIWKQLMDKSFGEEPVAPIEYSYGRASRRNPNSLYYTKHLVESRSIYIGWDTSMSITESDLDMFAGYAVKGMRKNDCTCTLIQADTRIADVRKIVNRKSFTKVEAMGRGGTDMRCILDYIEKHEKDPRNARLILLTDGYTPWRKSAIKTSVVYCSSGHEKMEDIWNSATLEANPDTEEY